MKEGKARTSKCRSTGQLTSNTIPHASFKCFDKSEFGCYSKINKVVAKFSRRDFNLKLKRHPYLLLSYNLKGSSLGFQCSWSHKHCFRRFQKLSTWNGGFQGPHTCFSAAFFVMVSSQDWCDFGVTKQACLSVWTSFHLELAQVTQLVEASDTS